MSLRWTLLPLKKATGTDLMLTKEKSVGVYPCGLRNVELIAIPGEGGGSFQVTPKGKLCILKVAVGYKLWNNVHSVLLHETLEMVLLDMGCRYRPSWDSAWSSDVFTFWFTHPQFCEAVARTSEFVAACQNDLAHVHRKYRGRKRV